MCDDRLRGGAEFCCSKLLEYFKLMLIPERRYRPRVLEQREEKQRKAGTIRGRNEALRGENAIYPNLNNRKLQRSGCGWAGRPVARWRRQNRLETANSGDRLRWRKVVATCWAI